MMKAKLPYALTFLSGLLLGWLALGWWLWPVAYVGDAYTYELNQADKLRYAQGAVDSFTLTGQIDQDWFSGWTGDEIKDELEQIVQQPNRANSTRAMAEKMGLLLGWRVNINPTPVPLTVKLSKAQVSEANPLVGILLGICAGVVVSFLIAGGIIAIFRKGRKSEVKLTQDTSPHYVDLRDTHYTPPRQASTTLANANLDFGPDQPCDQHFPIEREGTKLGEFGVNQVDDQSAWDVWLFDQQAIITVTKVLAEQGSEELASRGEIVEWKKPFTLDTDNLKMTGRAYKELDGSLRVDLVVEAKDEN